MKKPKRKNIRTQSEVRAPVEQFAVDYDAPQALCNCLIGRSEAQTDNNLHRCRQMIQLVVGLTQYCMLTPENAELLKVYLAAVVDDALQHKDEY